MGQRTRSQEKRRTSYYQEDEVGRLIVNMAQWNGDGASIRGSAGLWGRIVREFFRSSLPVVTVGVDAGRAKLALARMPVELAEALFTFHVSGLTIALQAKTIIGVSRDTYHRRLVEAHPRFMAEFAEVGREAARKAEELTRSVVVPVDHKLAPDGTAQPIKPRRLVKRKNA